MSKQYRLVVFDWEGTLSDTLGLIINCVTIEAKRLGFGDLDGSLARQYVELGLVKAVKKVFPHLNLQEYERLLAAVQRSLMARHSEVYLMPGAMEIVQSLYNKGIFLAIATNKSQQGLQRNLQTTRLDEFFKVTRCAGRLPAKPCTQMLEEILQEYSVRADETLMVGDSVTDMEMARNLQVDAIGVDFYNKQADHLRAAGALAVFDNYSLLANYLHLPGEDMRS